MVVFLWGLLVGDSRSVPMESVAARGNVVLQDDCLDCLHELAVSIRKKQIREQMRMQVRANIAAQEEEERYREYRRLARQEQTSRAKAGPGISDVVPVEYRRLVWETAARYDVDPRLLGSVVQVESRWDPITVGAHGDTGLMQILPETAQWIAGEMGLNTYNLFDPATNMDMGAWYLKSLYQDYGDWTKALAAYNGGPGAAPLGNNHAYVRRVMEVYTGAE